MSEVKVKKQKWTITALGYSFVWPVLMLHTTEHLLAIYSFYSMVIGTTLWQTIVFTCYMSYLSQIGVTVGAHRLFAHRSFKANFPLRLLLAFLQTISGQFSIHNWVRDHKMHHKFSDTDADPHNSNRGFFFCHFGWLVLRKHPEVVRKGQELRIEENLPETFCDPIVRFQHKYYWWLVILFWGIVPSVLPCYLWGESGWQSFAANICRHVIALEHTCLINSAAHLWGFRPYDKTLRPSQNKFVMYAMVGEGYHNYHHAFAWDYSISEHSWQKNFNPGTLFVDFFALIGWATDRKKASVEMIQKRRERTGDFTRDIQKLNPALLDWLIGITIQTWIIWLPLLIRAIIRTHCNNKSIFYYTLK